LKQIKKLSLFFEKNGNWGNVLLNNKYKCIFSIFDNLIFYRSLACGMGKRFGQLELPEVPPISISNISRRHSV